MQPAALPALVALPAVAQSGKLATQAGFERRRTGRYQRYGDGTVTATEAVAAEMPRLEDRDANDDGMVSAGEKANEAK